MRSEMLYTNGSFEICQEQMIVKQRRKHGWSIYLLPKKIFILKQKSSNLYMIGFKSVKNFWVIVYPHYIRNRSQWNAMWRDNQPQGYSSPILFPHSAKRVHDCSKIYYGCFEMLSWPHRTSANIINTCFWLLETCTKCSYILQENIRPGAQRLAFEVKYECIVRQPRIYRGPAFCAWASFQTSGDWSVNGK